MAAQRKKATYIGALVLRKYKLALIDLFERSGPEKRKLILLKIKGRRIWSTRQFNKILKHTLLKYPALTYDQCIDLIDYNTLKTDFTEWNKNFFLPQIISRGAQ